MVQFHLDSQSQGTKYQVRRGPISGAQVFDLEKYFWTKSLEGISIITLLGCKLHTVSL